MTHFYSYFILISMVFHL
uniref:Uncharacterized protein n=1 Tax=Anguilla anguilla TaxID=7936 RepID=A0A0E9XWZ1_ANGAN